MNETLRNGSNASRSIELWDGSRFCRKARRGARRQGVRESGKSAVDKDTGMSTRHGKEAMGKRQRRRSKESDKDFRSFRGKTLKARTLGVLSGWNKPVSHAGRKTCCEVAKTCERGAARPEVSFVSSDDDGAERAETQGGPRIPAW